MKRTAEFVTPKHPDKLADRIADAIVDAFIKLDPEARVAVEVLAGHGAIHIIGETTVAGITPQETSDKALETVQAFLKFEGLEIPEIDIRLAAQSPEIAHGVDDQEGAGDQGIVYGMATRETEETNEYLSLEYCLARHLCRYLYEKHPEDGKTQVTIEDDKIQTIVASFANTPRETLNKDIMEWLHVQPYGAVADGLAIFINPAGDWSQSGWDADTGLTGRKLAVDNYGGACPSGGGALSGKDPSKTDRSGAYMARKIAKTLLLQATRDENGQIYHAKIVHTRLAFAIGIPKPVEATAIIAWEDGQTTWANIDELDLFKFDLTPKGIIKSLNLHGIKYEPTARWGAFGNPDLPWEQPDNGSN